MIIKQNNLKKENKMATSREFRKQFVFRDNDSITESYNRFYRNNLTTINEVLPKVENVLNRALTDTEKIDIAVNKAEGLLKLYRPKFPFPNADDELNLRTLGVDLSSIIRTLNGMPTLPNDLEVDNGQIVLSKQFHIELIESATQYTQNENQNEAFALANKIIKLLEKADQIGHLSTLNKGAISRIIPIIDFEGGKLVPNRHAIRVIEA